MNDRQHIVRTRQAAFTLVEILIVVIILAILAAIVLPRFADAGESARSTNTLAQLRHARNQIARYRLDHDDNWPDLVTHQWDLLTQKTDFEGNLDADGKFGPYILSAPINPFTNSTTVAATEVAGNGWFYDNTVGDLNAVGFDEHTRKYTAPAP